MATVTGLTAERMLEIEAASVIDGEVVGDNLFLEKHDGSIINAGSVRGPAGPMGPVGQDQPVLTSVPILDTGIAGQIRAGRQLTVADFTAMGLVAPAGLWNLSDLTDASGNGRALTNKGVVQFDTGITGAPASSAKFSGLTAQALYIADTGVNDPLRIRTGSVGAWFKTAKRSTFQQIIAKTSTAAGQYGYALQVNSDNTARVVLSSTGSDQSVIGGKTDVCDNRWHFLVMTFDGTRLLLYVDAVVEAAYAFGALGFASSAPFNIGANGADGATAGAYPHFGRIDEAFVTSDVLTEDHIRNLYCASIPHTLGVVPNRLGLNVRRRRRGALVTSADFPTPPVRLYNFSAGSLGDSGSAGQALTAIGSPITAAGADGSGNNAYNLAGTQYFNNSDAGLPAALASRSFGCWFKAMQTTIPCIMAWGSGAASGCGACLGLSNTVLFSQSGALSAIIGPYVAEANWHHAVVVEDNGAADGLKQKLYLDGRLVGVATTMSSINLGGAAKFSIGRYPDGSGAVFIGQIDGVFVCDYALTPEQIFMLWNKSLLSFNPSPKNVGDHIESMNTARLLCAFDQIDSASQIDLVAA